MPVGPGKYDRECEQVLLHTRAEAVLVLVLNGQRGSGFSMSIDLARGSGAIDVPALLRSTANQIEESYGRS